jgi:hypothetical protein
LQGEGQEFESPRLHHTESATAGCESALVGSYSSRGPSHQDEPGGDPLVPDLKATRGHGPADRWECTDSCLCPRSNDRDRTFPSEDDDRKIESLITSISAAYVANVRGSAYVHKDQYPEIIQRNRPRVSC